VFVIVGIVVVFGSILFGYTMHHGQIGVLMQWSEFIIIGGAAIGAFLISNPMSVVTASVKQVVGLFKA
jgi:chemotaxis protein MotA